MIAEALPVPERKCWVAVEYVADCHLCEELSVVAFVYGIYYLHATMNVSLK